MIRKWLKGWSVILTATAVACTVQAQELNCDITVNAEQVAISDKSIFETMEQAFQDFINSRRWTDHQFEDQERIECNILIRVDNYSQNSNAVSAEATIQSSRPVFNSNYTTTMLNYVDKDFDFTYVPNQPLAFNEAAFTSNLTSMLAFYAYFILGLDYDTFSEEGGTDAYEQANSVVNNAQSTNAKGWKSHEDQRNRYWLMHEVTSSQFEPYRQALYQYHRLGLDLMYEAPDSARQNILEALETLKGVYNQKTSSVIIQQFFSAKRDELVGIFSEAKSEEKANAVQLLTTMDATNTKRYRNILK